MDHVEVLLQLQHRKSSMLTGVADGTSIETGWLGHSKLSWARVVSEIDGMYRCSASARDARAIAELLEMYRFKPVTLIRTVYARRTSVRSCGKYFALGRRRPAKAKRDRSGRSRSFLTRHHFTSTRRSMLATVLLPTDVDTLIGEVDLFLGLLATLAFVAHRSVPRGTTVESRPTDAHRDSSALPSTDETAEQGPPRSQARIRAPHCDERRAPPDAQRRTVCSASYRGGNDVSARGALHGAGLVHRTSLGINSSAPMVGCRF